MFDPRPTGMTSYGAVAGPEHDAVALRAACESIVLLQNPGGVLPLAKTDRDPVAVLGPNADSVDVLLGNYNGTPANPVTILSGLRRKAGPARILYAKGCEPVAGSADKAKNGKNDVVRRKSYDDALDCARRAGSVVMVLGLNAGLEAEESGFIAEGFDRGDRAVIGLLALQRIAGHVLAPGSRPCWCLPAVPPSGAISRVTRTWPSLTSGIPGSAAGTPWPT